jgi:hypothetical protein
MSRRLRRVLWGALIAVVAVALFALYDRLLGAAGGGALTWVREGVRYELVQPALLGVLLITPILMFVLGRSLADLPWPQRLLALVFRVAFLGLIAFSLARLVRTDDAHRVATVLLVDVSDSVSDQALGDAKKTIEAFYGARGREDVLRVVTFAERPRRVEIEQGGKLAIPASLRHDPRGKPPSASTNVESAIELAYGLFPPGYLKRAVVVCDGVETEGNLLAEAGRARALGVRLWAVPYRRPLPPEVAVVSLRLPDKVDVGQSFDVSADVYASRAAKVRAKLFQGEALNGLDGVREVELAPGPNEIKFQSVVRVGGEVTYDFKLEPLGTDEFSENNAYTATLDVPGRPAVLYVEGQPQRASYFANGSARSNSTSIRARRLRFRRRSASSNATISSRFPTCRKRR